MSTMYYTEEHEWVAVEGEKATIGVTDFAQQQLGDIVFIDLPAIGKQLTKDQEAAVIESVKAAGEIKSPIEGEVIAINETLADTPEIRNEDPMGDGGCFILSIKDDREIANLLDEASYKALIQD